MSNYTKFKSKLTPESFRILSVLSGLLILMLFFSITSQYFFTTNNLLTVALQSSIIAIIAIGQTFVLITAGIDLAIGSNMALAGVISGMLMVNGYNVFFAVLVGILSGALVGFISGVIIVKGDLPPFVVTLGAMSIVRGIALVITKGIPISGLPKSFQVIGNGKLLHIPIPAIIMILLTVIFSFILSKTKLGNYIYASGSNLEATKLSGINTNKVIIIVYTFSGFLAACAGVIMASRIASGQPSAGMGYELFAVASAVIGGTSLAGGEGLIIGTLIGALVIGVLRNGLNLLSVSAFWQEILIGVVIILAVYADRIKHRKK
ncbi:sugar ABC transporter permease [Vallitalea longa]|uniref:Sugar ABC transporter permease n=1 Tax=Vallitalea longa TaxID=2936439 RepID=A0A9W6DI48_9FIRM|nr:ABC transporter permease [Vallitalea longa]GKX31534.1 sugar ABC transporter permease [Vallitalea longa]